MENTVTLPVFDCPCCGARALKTPFFTPEDEKERDRRYYECGSAIYFAGPDTVNPTNPARPENIYDKSECCKLREEMEIADMVQATLDGPLIPATIPDTFGPED